MIPFTLNDNTDLAFLSNRGPIWINVNYLALSALHHYAQIESSYQERISKLYSKLRQGILNNVLKVHKNTGFYWEQYDDQSGKGIRGHPFTGWTSSIVNIFFEWY
jgi:mannosyl-oligosaccharide glucosidase